MIEQRVRWACNWNIIHRSPIFSKITMKLIFYKSCARFYYKLENSKILLSSSLKLNNIYTRTYTHTRNASSLAQTGPNPIPSILDPAENNQYPISQQPRFPEPEPPISSRLRFQSISRENLPSTSFLPSFLPAKRNNTADISWKGRKKARGCIYLLYWGEEGGNSASGNSYRPRCGCRMLWERQRERERGLVVAGWAVVVSTPGERRRGPRKAWRHPRRPCIPAVRILGSWRAPPATAVTRPAPRAARAASKSNYLRSYSCYLNWKESSAWGWGEDRSIREMWNDKMGEVFEGVIRRFSWSIVLIWKGLNNILARIRFF